jgi:hypothetical protein
MHCQRSLTSRLNIRALRKPNPQSAEIHIDQEHAARRGSQSLPRVERRKRTSIRVHFVRVLSVARDRRDTSLDTL